jgi:mRNA interferase MazF
MKTREVPDFRRGDILWIDCEPSLGAEPSTIRTCVVVSNDLANRFGAAVTVVPTLAYRADRAQRPFNVDLRSPRSTMKARRVANASMVMTYDRRRIVSRAGKVSPEAMKDIEAALSTHLSLIEP